MELEPDTIGTFVGLAFSQMLDVAERLGDDRVDLRPHGPATNSVAALVLHCCGVAEFWLGHVGLGRASNRVREEEFAQTATVAELHGAVDRSKAQIESDVVELAAAPVSPYVEGRQFLPGGDRSDASLVLHLIEELFQHLGHIDLTADALTAADRDGD
ncbi:MAG: DUF664 domain-containing protein [Acidimicrobiales bacterium]